MAKAPPPPDPVFTLRGSAAPINALHFQCSGPGPPLLYSGLEKGSVDVWNLNTRRTERVLDGHHGASVIWVSTLPSSDTLLSQGRDMRVCVWDLCEGRSTVTHTLHTGSVGFCQCSQLEADISTTLLAIPGETTEEVKVVDLGSLTTLCSLTPDAKRGMLMCMKMWQADTGPLLTAGYEDGTLVVWDVSLRRPISCLKAHTEPVMCLDFDTGRGKGISGSSDNALSSWTLDSQRSLQIQAPVVLTNPGVSQLRIRGDSKIVASAGWDCRVRVHSWKSLNPLAVLCYHRDQVRCVTFSDHPESTQTLMAAGSRDQLISLWSIYSASRGTRPERHERYRTAGEFKRCPLDWPGLACIHHMGLITGAGPGWPGQGGLAC
ncbi:guanine nucleotide-binding protein subunit beta-like protein 1 isoform X1 [Electrophorus electricus]|uniref:Guanine nucleotide binding protein (G protein), beta polypeptide 1-like n=1 Tax=Electrophorus electricus TaxID=8005 RepID=A0A4W4FRS6_ELEEL|nr:guanine nucleotide-binding protein subunit beta-like protein 1 isoform X1 [Electrophorus electricus]XP_035385642.1 guanine nucleotide-binding protein subunit beta-like protein 1 isoform X1 [Electrophorus electricus]XP_035385643.1 guanine nucleotide-binding protein subunit beta-like protein 1 isoform X1 [Electrophorus electricus]